MTTEEQLQKILEKLEELQMTVNGHERVLTDITKSEESRGDGQRSTDVPNTSTVLPPTPSTPRVIVASKDADDQLARAVKRLNLPDGFVFDPASERELDDVLYAWERRLLDVIGKWDQQRHNWGQLKDGLAKELFPNSAQVAV